MKKIIVLSLMLCAAALNAAPMFIFDYATFRAGDVTLLQVHTMINRNSLEFEPSDSIFRAEYEIMVEIKRADSLLASSAYDRTDKVASLEAIAPTHKIPEETSFHIKKGDFTVAVIVTDKVSGESSRHEQELKVEPYSWDTLSISDIEFASEVKRASTKGAFTKNQLLVIPHADRVFGGEMLTAYYYAEIYNLSVEKAGEKYTIKRTILDQNNSEFKTLPDKRLDQNASSVVEANFFSCATLPTGTYFLKLEVVDGVTGQKAEKTKRFWVWKQDEELTPQSFITLGKLEEAIGSLTEEEAKREIEYIRYLTNRSDDKIIRKLKPQGNKAFLTSFWMNRDPSGVMRQRYLARIEVTEQRYGTKIQEGWKTDRGRALIMYGEPDLIERRLFELNAPDSEIWYYDQLEGGVVFLFTDLKGTGDLQQVYSSMRGEFIDAGWVQDMERRNPDVLRELRNR